MASIVWSPDGALPLPNKTIDIQVNDSVSALYTPTTTDIISNVTATWNASTSLILTPSFTGTTATVTITGTQGIDVFNQYSAKYIDRGQSDNTQTPVIVTDLTLVPDFKEIYQINVDPRTSINLSFNIVVYIENNLVPVTSYTQTYNFDVFQTYTNVKTWTDDYFTNRY